MLRIILEETLDLGEELCSCFIEWQMACDYVNWSKLMQIIKETGIKLHKRQLISKLYVDHIVEVKLNQGETRSATVGRVRQGCYLSLILFIVYSKYLTKAAVEVFGDFQIGGQVICTVKYADDLVLLAKEDMVVSSCIIEKLIEIERCYGLDMDVENN
jgi:hypothetical protein